MILDAHNLFSDAQAVTASAASTNIIDLGAVRDLGTGENLYIVVLVDTAFTDSGSDSTIAVTVETDDNEAFSSPSLSRMALGTFAALSAAGSRFVARLQPERINERYMRVYYTAANGNLTTGAFTAFLTKDIYAYTSYADAITIS